MKFSTVKLKKVLTDAIDAAIERSGKRASRASFVAEACKNFLKIQQSNLTDEEYKYIEQTIKQIVKENCVGRKVFHKNYLPDAGFMGVKGRNRHIPIPVMYKRFVLSWKDICVDRTKDSLINIEVIKDACLQVCMEEDILLLTGEHKGWTALGIEGLATTTGRNVVSSNGWSENIRCDIRTAIKELQKNGHVHHKYSLIVNYESGNQINQLIQSQAIDNLYYEKGLIIYLKTAQLKTDHYHIDVFGTPALFTIEGKQNNALLLAPNIENANVKNPKIIPKYEIVIGQDMTDFWWKGQPSQDPEKSIDDGNFYGKIYEALVPRINDPTSICEIQNIAS